MWQKEEFFGFTTILKVYSFHYLLNMSLLRNNKTSYRLLNQKEGGDIKKSAFFVAFGSHLMVKFGKYARDPLL